LVRDSLPRILEVSSREERSHIAILQVQKPKITPVLNAKTLFQGHPQHHNPGDRVEGAGCQQREASDQKTAWMRGITN